MSLSFISLQIASPLNQPNCTVTIEPGDTVADVIAKALKITSPGDDLDPKSYGIFVSPHNSWLFPMALMSDCVHQIQVSGVKSEPVFELCPKNPITVSISCGPYDINLSCDPLQKIESVAKQAARELLPTDKFFNWQEWSLWHETERLPDDIRCCDIQNLETIVLIMKREFPPVRDAPEKIFKKTIVDALAREPGRQIPLFLELLIENIENNAATEGLFRKCGLQQAINDMCDKLDANDFQNEDEMRETLLKLSPHDATGILKAYLGTLTIPIVPQAFHPWLMQAEANADVVDKLCAYKKVVNALPDVSCAVMARLAKCGDVIVKNGKANKMTLPALAVCLTTSIIGRNIQVPTSLDVSQPSETNALEMSTVCAMLLSKSAFLYNVGEISRLGVCVESFEGSEVGEEYVCSGGDETVTLYRKDCEEAITAPKRCWVGYDSMIMKMKRRSLPGIKKRVYGRYFLKLPTGTFSAETQKWLEEKAEAISEQTEKIRSESRKLSALLLQLDEDQGNDDDIMALVEKYRFTPVLDL